MNSISMYRPLTLCIVLACFHSGQAFAAELVVKVTGISVSGGQIGCALFKSSEGFPMNNALAQQQWLPANSAGVICRFADVPEGSYAASVSHDLNGNKKVDTNLFGIPIEAWGVSNNVRPLMRAPRFDEAKFEIKGGSNVTLDVRVDK